MTKNQEIQISKTMCHALRHYPEKYNLVLDNEGYVDIDILINGIKEHLPKYRFFMKKDFINIINNDDKGRFQLKDNYVKAVYGHSFKKKIEKSPSNPPLFLYHGTTKENADNILKAGLKPMGRQYVHLSCEVETAIIVGKRRTTSPVILVIDCKKALENGSKFYKEPCDIWLSDYVDSQYITVK